MSQTTTRYAIELEKGKYLSLFGHAVRFGLERHYTSDESAEHDLRSCKHYPHARIVCVKCEVVDEA